MGTQTLLDGALEHIEKLLTSPVPPEFPAGMDEVPKLRSIHDYLVTLRSVLDAFAKGNLEGDIVLRGVIAGRLKALQANLLHLAWQIQQVAAGDFTQRVEYMGEYAVAFNSMVEQLDGALTSLRHKEEELTKLTEALQVEISKKVAALAARRKSESQFKHLAEHDVLTGVFNRRSFYELASAEFKRAEEEGYPCNLALIDIDLFKAINDTHGHLGGDAALRLLTETIGASLRKGGTIGRYGGDEFVVLLPELGLEAAKKVAERLRKAVAGSTINMASGPINITISIGLAHVSPEPGRAQSATFFDSVLKVADEALYTAKKSGRNCLVVIPYHTEQPPI